MEAAQKMEWSKAQEIAFSIDLVKATKQQLEFLTVVDSYRCLYAGPVLDRAIYKYNNCWLPLLAKHSESSISEGPLVVPLDCEWVWHCHRLNPLQYKRDCEEIYGKILDKYNVLSTVQGAYMMNQTECIWRKMYPTEAYTLDLTGGDLPMIIDGTTVEAQRSTDYDLVGAVKRQSSFLSKLAGQVTNDDNFLKEAVARYKAFLHLIKKRRENSINSFHVPTRDIDLIWHSHQLHPAAYTKDLKGILGKVLDHNDGDPKRSDGFIIDLEYAQTAKFWQETFGRPYQNPQVMYNDGDQLSRCGHVQGHWGDAVKFAAVNVPQIPGGASCSCLSHGSNI